MRKQFQNPIITIGRDDRGNEHKLMKEVDNTIHDLYWERIFKEGEFLHTYYSKKFNEISNVRA